MADKKYILKSEITKFDDGTSNEEHIKDIVAQMELLYGNIQDNNDICEQTYRLKQDIVEQDILDAFEVSCSKMIEIEKHAYDIMQAVEKYKDKLDKNCQPDLESLLKQIANLEKKSKKIMETVFFA